MALTNQPYLPLYVDDWMNNNKLKMCSAASHGIMITIMCIMHKEVEYGKILLKQKFKQNDKQIINFALQIAKLSAFDFAEIEKPLSELINEGVLTIDNDFLICPRMVKDFDISEKRAKAGSSGGNKKKSSDFATAKKQANIVANTEAKSEANAVNGIVIENVNESVVEKGKEGAGEKPKRASKTDAENPKIIYPFDTETFKTQWRLWLSYKHTSHSFKYKTPESENVALKTLFTKSGGNEKNAIAMINESISNGWSGLFELKNISDGKPKAAGTRADFHSNR